MIPYIHIPSLKIWGPIAIQPFGVMVSMAVLFGILLARRRCRVTGLSAERFDESLIWLLVPAFVIAHLASQFFYYYKDVIDNPMSLLDIRAGYSSFGGFFGALLGVAIFLKRKKIPLTLYTDTVIFGFVPAWIFGRAGCTLAFDHPGVPTSLFLGEMDKSGIVRHNLGFEEMLFTILLTAILYSVRNVKPFRGFHTALMMVLYAPVRFFLDFLRVADTTYFSLTPAQYLAIVMLVWGGVMMIRGFLSEPLKKARG